MRKNIRLCSFFNKGLLNYTNSESSNETKHSISVYIIYKEYFFLFQFFLISFLCRTKLFTKFRKEKNNNSHSHSFLLFCYSFFFLIRFPFYYFLKFYQLNPKWKFEIREVISNRKPAFIILNIITCTCWKIKSHSCYEEIRQVRDRVLNWRESE